MKKLIIKSLILFCWMIFISFSFFNDLHAYTRIMFHEMYNQNENIDILLLGASHVYRGIDPQLLSEEMGCNVFNASSSSQQLQGSYYIIKEAAKYNQIDTVVLDVNYGVNTLESDGDIQTYIITDFIRNSFDKFHYILSAKGANGIMSNFFPIMHAINNPNRISNPIKLITGKLSYDYINYNYNMVKYDNEEYVGDGFVRSYEVLNPNNVNWNPDKIDRNNIVPEYTIQWLEKITTLCNQNNIRLVLIDCPITDASAFLEMDNYQKYINVISDFAVENSLAYYNFNLIGNRELNMRMSDFKDAVHMNGQGAVKFTMILSDFMKGDEYSFYDSLQDKYDHDDYDETLLYINR